VLFVSLYLIGDYIVSKFRDPLSPRQRVVAPVGGASLVKSEFAAQAEINGIVRRFLATGVAPGARGVPMNGDFCNAPDFQTSMNLMIKARNAFDSLPAKVRREFDHDPGRLIGFLEDPKNRDKAVELGLIERPPERTRDVVQAVDELAAKLVPKV